MSGSFIPLGIGAVFLMVTDNFGSVFIDNSVYPFYNSIWMWVGRYRSGFLNINELPDFLEKFWLERIWNGGKLPIQFLTSTSATVTASWSSKEYAWLTWRINLLLWNGPTLLFAIVNGQKLNLQSWTASLKLIQKYQLRTFSKCFFTPRCPAVTSSKCNTSAFLLVGITGCFFGTRQSSFSRIRFNTPSSMLIQFH